MVLNTIDLFAESENRMRNNYLTLFKNSFKKNSFIFLLVVFFQIIYLALMNISFYFSSPTLEAIIKGNFQSFKKT